MVKKIIETKKAPAPIGPYNQAILIGDILYTSGQIAIEPESGELKTDNIKDETNLVMNNLKAILEASNMTFDNVVKATIFVSDMKNFSEINSIYGKYFKNHIAPARETVEVDNLPKFVNVEISFIASF
jgi:2-iminobutanoate/2-iminopropanoate deaminase